MSLYETIDDLCARKGINVTTMCRECEISRASISDLKMGRKNSLSTKTLSKIADYFGVTTDYLLGKETQKAPTALLDGELEENVVIFHRDGKNQQRKLTKEQMDMLIGMLNAIPKEPKDL